MGDWSRDSGTTSPTFQVGGPSGPNATPFLSMANPAALAGLSVSSPATLASGQQAYVQSLKALFYLDPTSTATPDNVVYIAAQGGGNWIWIAMPGALTATQWTDVAAGTTLAASLSRPNLACDSSGVQTTVTLPTAAQMAAADGFQFTIKATGNMLSPVVVNAGAGTTVELANAPGTFGASTWLPIQGQSVFYKYDKATTTWKAWSSSTGTGAPGTSAYNPGWYTTLANAAWDPAAGVDSNSGAPGSPLLTMGEVARRCGSHDVTMPAGAGVKITQLTAQPANVDPVDMTWHTSQGGAAVLLGTLALKTASFVPGGALTAKNQATGTTLAIGGFPVGTAAGDYVHNIDKDSYAIADTAGATPKFSNPIPAATIKTVTTPTLAEDNTWAAADHYEIFTRIPCNLKNWRVRVGDVSAGGVVGVGWVQWVSIVDSSGTGGNEFPLVNDGAATILSGCQIQGQCHIASTQGRGTAAYLLGTDVIGAVAAYSGAWVAYGAILRGSIANIPNNGTLDGGTLLHGVLNINQGFMFWADCFGDSSVTVGGGQLRITVSTGGTSAIWGSVAINCTAGGSCVRVTGANWAAVLLTSGAKLLDGAGTGSAYVGAGVNTDGIAITAANIDTGAAGGPGLFNPITGARYCNN